MRGHGRRESAPDEYRTWLPPEHTLGVGTPEKEVLTPLPKEDRSLPNPDRKRDEFNLERELRTETPVDDAVAQAKRKKRRKRIQRLLYGTFSAAFMVGGVVIADPALFGTVETVETSAVSPTGAALPGESTSLLPEETEKTSETAAGPTQKFDLHPMYSVYDTVGMISVFDGAIDFESENFGERRLAFSPFNEGTFTGKELPEATVIDGYTNIGYILICDGTSPVSVTGHTQRPTSTWMLTGNEFTPEDLRHVKIALRSGIEIRMVRFDPTRQGMQMIVGMHANGGAFDADAYPLFPDVTPEYCEVSSGTAMYSEGWSYLDAYPVPKREGYRFTGWYSTQEAAEADPFSEAAEKERICAIRAHDFYEKDPSASEGVDWNKPVTYHVYAGWQKE